MTDRERADRIDAAAATLQKYARVLRGEQEDPTGRGLWDIFISQMNWALPGVVIYTAHGPNPMKYPFPPIQGE